MDWKVIIISFIPIALIKLLVSSPPTVFVEWMIGKFQVHPKLNELSVKVYWQEQELYGEEKIQLVADLNQAIYLNQFETVPVFEGSPYRIENNGRKKKESLYIYPSDQHANVVKVVNKKVTAYRLLL